MCKVSIYNLLVKNAHPYRNNLLVLILIIVINFSLFFNSISLLIIDGDQIQDNYTQLDIVDQVPSFGALGASKIEVENELKNTSRSRQIGFSINSLKSFEVTDIGEIETDKFYSSKTMLIKTNISHDGGADKISRAELKIIGSQNNESLLPYSNMSVKANPPGKNWKWYDYEYTFPSNTPRQTYVITVKATSISPEPTELNSTKTIEILNQPPEIIKNIEPFYMKEKDEIWTLNLAWFKQDLEDLDENLRWIIENVSESLLNVTIIGDIIRFNLVPNAYGSNRLKLILEDSDHGRDTTWFWIFVEPVNDPPKIISIPTQEKFEDSKPWLLNLTEYGYDEEDTSNQRLLNWSFKGVNSSLIQVEIVEELRETLLKIIPMPNAYGSDSIILRATDSEGLTATHNLWINIIPLNDPPVWEPINKMKIYEQFNPTILSLYDYLSDVDNSKKDLKIEILSKSPSFLKGTIDDFGNLNLTIDEPQYIGSGAIILSVSDGIHSSETTINFIFRLAEFKVRLLAPDNTSIVPTDRPTLHWHVDKPSNMGEILFDVYLNIDETLVLKHNHQALVMANQEVNEYRTTNLKNNEWFYWTVVPKYFDENNETHYGRTVEGVLNFRIDIESGDQLPLSLLLSPKSNEVITTREVNLTWLGYDPNGDYPIWYKLYLSTNKDDIINQELEANVDLRDPIEQFYEYSGLVDNEIYYWAVIPIVDDDKKGKCSNSFGVFAVDISNTLPKTNLLLPKDDISVPKSPILYWDYHDPDPFENLYFDIYLSDDKERVLQTRIATVQDVTNYYLPSLISNKKYYWTVISHDKVGPGNCACGIWSFTIDESLTNHPPITKLIGPKDHRMFSKDSIRLSWNSTDVDRDKIAYTLYLSENYNLISKLDNSVRFTSTSETSVIISNLDEGKKYYWTVIPNDGKVPGICLSEVWSFEIKQQDTPAQELVTGSDQILRTVQYSLLIILIVIVISIPIWVYQKRRRISRLKKIIKAKPDVKLTEDMKATLLSPDTLRAMHVQGIEVTQDLKIKGMPSKRRKRPRVVHVEYTRIDKRIRPDPLKIRTKEGITQKKDELIIKKETRKLLDKYKPKPYTAGEYQYSVEKSRYKHIAKRHAEQVKNAIPYASGERRGNHIMTKTDLKVATPLIKKGLVKKALKASTLPITRECPKCGSFKVRTYKNDANKCLECKNKF